MLKRMLISMLILLLTALPAVSALAEPFSDFEDLTNEIPEEPVVTDADGVTVTAEYDAVSDLSRYTATLKDGAGVTARDVLFSLYYYLDPGCTEKTGLAGLDVSGLDSYRLQLSPEHIAEATADMEAIRDAGREHIWSETDPWTEAEQTAYWKLSDEYAATCEAEYPTCVKHIVDACSLDWVAIGDWTAEQVAADEGLKIANAMVQWGYAHAEDDGSIVGARTGTVWNLRDGYAPSIDDFVNELKQVYGDDLGACWAVEGTVNYEPQLPDLTGGFLRACYADNPDHVTSVSGIRMEDENTVVVELEGIDMHAEAELFGVKLLPLDAYGDAAQWSPDEGLYGHAFGDVSGISNALSADGGAQTVTLLEAGEFTFG